MLSLKISFYMAAAALVAVGIGVHSCQSAVYTEEDGRAFLQSRGYSNISGGKRDYMNMCGKDAAARSYEAINPEGKKVSQVVCFMPVIGPYLPL